MQCGADKSEEPAASGLPSLTADDQATLKKLLALDFGKAQDFKGKGVAGKIWKADMAPFTGTWVKSDMVFENCTAADYANYKKCMAETTKEDKAVKEAENTSKDANGVVDGLYVQFKMGMMISNRDMSIQIVNHKRPGDCNPDDMKVEEVTLWKDLPKDKAKAEQKKVVRMKVLCFSFGQETDKGYRVLGFDNYDFGGSLPTKIVNKFVGNKDDFIIMAKQIATIKGNGGKYKKS